MSKQSIGDKIRKFRTEVLSLSQRELGLELDSTQAGISQIESGEVLPSASFMKKLAERFPDVNYNWLFFDEGEATRRLSQIKIRDKIRSQTESELRASFEEKYQKLQDELAQLKLYNDTLINVLNNQHNLNSGKLANIKPKTTRAANSKTKRASKAKK